MNKKIKINLNDTKTIKKFISVVRSFDFDVDVMTERSLIDGKSILGLFSLDLSGDIYVKIISDDVEEIRKFETAMEEFAA